MCCAVQRLTLNRWEGFPFPLCSRAPGLPWLLPPAFPSTPAPLGSISGPHCGQRQAGGRQSSCELQGAWLPSFILRPALCLEP